MIDEFQMLYNLGRLMQSQWYSTEDLIKLQEKKMRSLVKYAYDNIPLYHEKMRQVNVRPDDIKQIKDLTKIPLTTKSDIQQAYPERIVVSTVDLDKSWKPKTGGSTGIPLTMVYDKKAEYYEKAVALRANLSVGQKIWDKWCVLTSPDHFLKPRWFQKFRILDLKYISIYDDVPQIIDNLNRLKPDILDGYPTAIWTVARSLPDDHEISPKIVFTTAELLDPPMRKEIESKFKKSLVIDQFGCVEIGRTAWECEEKEGYHIDMEAVIMEFIRDGEQVYDEKGDIVYTCLYNYAMPLIRYAIGDVGLPTSEKPTCGRGLSLMKVVEGRKDDFLVLSDGRIISPRVISVLMKKVDGIKMYLFIQKTLNKFNVDIIKEDNYSESNIEQQLNSVIRNGLSLGDNEEIVVNFTDKIQRKTRKLRKVVSNVKIDQN